jgi:hypothetical protein
VLSSLPSLPVEQEIRMKSPLRFVTALSLSASWLFCYAVTAQQVPTTAASSSAVGASTDNTKMNIRDRTDATVKPTNQPNDRADIKVAAAVRRAIVALSRFVWKSVIWPSGRLV